MFNLKQPLTDRTWSLWRRGRTTTYLHALLLACFSCIAQVPTVDSFTADTDGEVFALAVQPDGKILVGGGFSLVAGQSRNRIARINPDGTLDSTFNASADHAVNSISIQADGKILVGGSFTTVNGQLLEAVARLNADGTVDNEFAPNAKGSSSCTAIQPDQRILAAGEFLSLFGEYTRRYLARFTPDGGKDNTFATGTLLWDSFVLAIVLQLDGKIILGGRLYAGTSSCFLLRLNTDGTRDTTFNVEANGPVLSLARQTDGKILIGGGFGYLGGQPRRFIGRLNADGTLDYSFNPPTPGANDQVIAVACQPDGKIVIGGYFTNIAGQARSHLARLNSDGSLDSEFEVGTGAMVRTGVIPFPSHVESIAIQADGKILVGGRFETVGGQSRTNLARINPAMRSLALLPASGDSFSLSLSGIAGQSFDLETATNSLGPWTAVDTFTLPTAAVTLPWTNAGEQTRFFRLRPR